MHDFEPGIEDSGLFWTIPISQSSLDVDQHKGRARLRADKLKIPDFHDFANAVSSLPPGPPPESTPSRVSFDVRWAGGGERTRLHDATYGFEGDFVTGEATISFTARNDGSDTVFRSDPGDQSTVGPPGVGRERNGVFFS